MAKKKKKEKPIASEPDTVSAEQPETETAAGCADGESAPQNPTSAEQASEPQTEQTNTNEEEEIVVSSVIHTTTVLEDSPSSAPESVAEEEPDLSEEEKEKLRRDNADFSMIDESHDNPYRNVFVQSLEYVTADDLGAPPKKKKKDPVDVIIELFRKAIFWAAVVAFFVSGYQIVAKLYSYHQADEIYGGFENIFEQTDRREDLVAYAIRSSAMSTLTPVNGTKEESDTNANAGYDTQFNEKLMIVQGQLQLLRNENKEVVGWIEMPGDTKINYPVVQGEDNDYYLHYAYNGAYNPAGSIYLDYRNSVSVSTNRHTVIYGHNMESGSPMFANLLHFQDESYWKNNRYIHIYTDEAMYTYEVFAAYETSPQLAGVENHSWRMNFNKDEKLFLQWVDSVRARSDISPKVTIEGNSRILTLSTCMNVNENRYVVHAVLAEVSK
ncbi:MAG: class B sortase [Clostridia bacterium]|nr:class B sortase [Clostridia bacterium]